LQEELLKRREEMGKEQLDRTKRFTDDGKLRGIISSAKFVPETSSHEESVGFGLLFKRMGREAEEIDRELNIVDDDDKVIKKRKVVALAETTPVPEKPKMILKLKFSNSKLEGISMEMQKSFAAVTGEKVHRRVQFVDA
jgi:hypothetical protein